LIRAFKLTCISSRDDDVGLWDDDDDGSQKELHAPFDITVAVPTLSAEDAPPQSNILQALHRLGDDEERSSYFNQLPIRIRLSTLASYYKKGAVTSALGLLSKRINLQVDSAYTISSDDNMLSWNADSNFLDFLTCVSADLGFDAFIPNVVSMHNYQFRLNLKQPIRAFPTKYAKLGFNPSGSILWIGQSHTSEDVWIGMAYRALIMFFASMLKRTRYHGLYLNDPYPDLEDMANIHRVTNIMCVYNDDSAREQCICPAHYD
jgi:hypothetical protein